VRPQKRSFSIAGHQTSISLEEPFWQALREVAHQRGTTLAGLVSEIDGQRGGANLSSAVRVWLLAHYRAAARLPAARS
jgi:predicted DNA-binding ribbon-helix-helix protein